MQLFYREKGDKSQPALILLHGLWGASENWLPVANRLTGHYHVILPDLPNHGASPHIPRHDYDTLSDSIYEWIIQLELQVPLYLAGHSMGGKTLMTLLLKHPEITRKAIVIDIAPKDYARTPETRLHENLCHYLQSTSPGNFHERDTFLSDIRTHFPEDETFHLLAKNIRKNKETGCFEWKINVESICPTSPACKAGKILHSIGLTQATYCSLKVKIPITSTPEKTHLRSDAYFPRPHSP